MTKLLLGLSIFCFIVSSAGCASMLFGSPIPGSIDLPSLLIELNMTIEALEQTSIPLDASEADVAAFVAVQAARKAFVLQLIEAIERKDPTFDLSRYRATIEKPDIVNGV